MANYLKGIGDAATGVNEILPVMDARIHKFFLGYTSGVVKGELYEFDAEVIDRGVIVKSGFMQAQGYFGCCDTETQINFVMPGGTNYVHLYAEIDLSVVPNRFGIKATAASNSPDYTFRQDNLRAIQSGKYQMSLWQVTLTANNITLADKRAFIQKPADAAHADEATHASEADRALNADNATVAATAVRVNDRISFTTAVEFYVGGKLIRIEA
jgi:hypothetical protein